jgi:hypothetical protein
MIEVGMVIATIVGHDLRNLRGAPTLRCDRSVGSHVAKIHGILIFFDASLKPDPRWRACEV